MTSEEDITAAVAPSVDLEQQLYNVIGLATTRIDAELQVKKAKNAVVYRAGIWVLLKRKAACSA